jgi:hypothetical protein
MPITAHPIANWAQREIAIPTNLDSPSDVWFAGSRSLAWVRCQVEGEPGDVLAIYHVYLVGIVIRKLGVAA